MPAFTDRSPSTSTALRARRVASLCTGFVMLVVSVAASGDTHAPDARSNADGAPEVWSGTDFFFAKEDSADWTLPENQDRITDGVWLTRAHRRGIFNIAQEPGYTKDSPAGTEWATGKAADWESLTFKTWYLWANGIPPNTVGVDAVLHLLAEDVYLDIRFESWSLGDEGGYGGFSYSRASDPTPVRGASWSSIKGAFRVERPAGRP